jgi:hypothetical protein
MTSVSLLLRGNNGRVLSMLDHSLDPMLLTSNNSLLQTGNHHW